MEAHLCGEGLGHGGQAEQLMCEREVGIGVAATAARLRAQEIRQRAARETRHQPDALH